MEKDGGKKRKKADDEAPAADGRDGEAATPSKTESKTPSQIKNKIKRKELWEKLKHEKKKQKKKERTKRQKLHEKLGDEMPKTLEDKREVDETLVKPDDEEVMQDIKEDEFADYYTKGRMPKYLKKFITDIEELIPNATYFKRKRVEIKRFVAYGKENGYTDLLIFNEKLKRPNGLIIIHLPDGPTANFKLTSAVLPEKIQGHGRLTSHEPEVILNNFNTRLGMTVGRMLGALFPQRPNFVGRRAVTWHNQRDFIFFRHHRYIFENGQKVRLQELGPRFCLKLRSLQRGTMDTKFGEYVWVHKKEMDTSRARFFL